jgi:hypothetical protein
MMMRQLLVALALISVPISVQAQNFYDGHAHMVSGPTGPIAISSSTSLTIADGASVTDGVTVDWTSTLVVSGGNVLGANGFGPAASGGVGVTSQGMFSGSGGMVQGGTSVDDNGHGGYAVVSMGKTQITGGTYLGGDGSSNSGIGGTGLSTSLNGLQITGGIFTGGVATHDGNGAFIDGGKGDRGSISGGSFTGANSLVFWGTGNAELDISGGTYKGIMNMLLLGMSSIHFLGSDFQFNAGTGLLTGELASGTALDLTLQSVIPYTLSEGASQVILASDDPPPTPEPATIILLGTGTLAILRTRSGRISKK